MLHKWSKWGLKLLWVVGLFGLILIVYHFELTIKQTVDETYNVLPLVWFDSIVPFLFGVYISLLFVKEWSFKINKSLLLCITLPCLIISFFIPIVFTLVSNTTFSSYFSNEPLPFWLFKLNSSRITPIVASLTLIVGLFQNTQPSKN
ncbi:hypothetical protein AN964_22920 [Heyndrickxia shackletonii]|uniref:Uncharacterized protein n=1 Tax=Heyndrickxia shackletonii TaxID=157838 RepID=A0A0Q3TAF0_9BACI|nr:hypothetical protein [Heyndrickxia shackletonii]KQL50513.1 hypothetical protein AN964_22920 [Heyndrickxia shackletonii]NEY98184.1 hypothetical protein [Heyndrickxia shackletonii]